MIDKKEIEQSIREYVLNEVLSGEDPAKVTLSTPLFTSGILDSFATLRLVQFLEQKFLITIEAREVAPEYLNTIELISRLVESKISAAA